MSPVLITFIILLCLTMIAIIVHTATRKQVKAECEVSRDCPKNYNCIFNPESNRKECHVSNKKFCKIDKDNLTECKLDDEKACNECLNDPEFSCIQVTDDKPYQWIKDGKKIKMPNSKDGYGWCLPDVDTTTISCNPYTADTVLISKGKHSYEWGCHCRRPNLFDHTSGPDSDCVLVRACGALDSPEPGRKTNRLLVPSERECKIDENCKESEKCLAPMINPPCGYDGLKSTNNSNISDIFTQIGGVKKYCHVDWNQSGVREKIDPLQGQCDCRANENSQYYCYDGGATINMECRTSLQHCDPGELTTEGCQEGGCMTDPASHCCKCPKGYIRCPDDILSSVDLCDYCRDIAPSCVKDPCYIEDLGGHYNRDKLACICPWPAVATESVDSIVGQICLVP